MTAFPIVKEGLPFIGIMSCITALVAVISNVYWAILPAIVCGFFIYFFRNPRRKIVYDPAHLLSPADGKVMSITEVQDDEYLGEAGTKVTIFLSVFDVHVNRSPMSGKVKYQRYTCGGFVPAYKKAASFENERHAIGIENNGKHILVIQIAGILARRIISWVTLGHQLKQGECYGMIKFGSSTEIVMPKSVDVLVKKGDKVKGGVTIIGKYKK